MLRKRMIINVAAAASIYLLSGCSTSGPTAIDPVNGNNNGGNTTTSSINDLKFSKVSEDKQSQYNNLISQNAVNESAKAQAATGSGGTTAAAPSAVATAPMVATAGDAKMASGMAAYPMN